MEKTGRSYGEIPFIDSVLSLDSKNYNAWTYRIWLTKTYGLYQQEQEQVGRFMEEDVKNNSAWNYRYYLM